MRGSWAPWPLPRGGLPPPLTLVALGVVVVEATGGDVGGNLVPWPVDVAPRHHVDLLGGAIVVGHDLGWGRDVGGTRPPVAPWGPRWPRAGAGSHLEVTAHRVHVPQGVVALPVPVLVDLQEAGDAWGRRARGSGTSQGPQPGDGARGQRWRGRWLRRAQGCKSPSRWLRSQNTSLGAWRAGSTQPCWGRDGDRDRTGTGRGWDAHRRRCGSTSGG